MKTDSQLQKDVLDELKWDPAVKEGRIGVTTKNGIVTVSGFVDAYAEEVAAERAAKRVSGVKAVVNNIEVDLASSSIRPDEDIARAAISAMKWDAEIPADRFRVVVEKGFVTLEGSAEWQYQKNAAERIVRNLKGVRGVLNHITLKPQASGPDIRIKIESALKRHAEREANRISILATGDEVTLRGEVDSWSDREAVEGAVWSAPGVRVVHDELRVNPNV